MASNPDLARRRPSLANAMAAFALALAPVGCGARGELEDVAGPAPPETTSATETAPPTTSSGASTTSTTEAPSPCDVADADADGHAAAACGGDDCDDTDPSVHPGAPDDAAGTWTLSTVAPGPGTFRSTALALDAADEPHLAYVDKTSTDLLWAGRDGDVWKTEVVADAWSGPTRSASLVIDPAGVSHIAYAASGLRYATGGPGAWQTEVVDETAGTGYHNTSMVAAGGDLHVAYRQLSSIFYQRFDGAVWSFQVVASNGSAYGADVSIGVDGSQRVHISFESVIGGDFGQTTLRYATSAGGDFQTEDIEELPPKSGQTYDALAVTPEGLAHIAYRDGSIGALRLATGESGAWTKETVDGTDDAGSHASIAMDARGALHIAYRAAAAKELRHATNASGTWQIETVDGQTDTGLYTSVKVDSKGHVHIGYVDAGESTVRHATNAPAADGVDQDCDGQDG